MISDTLKTTWHILAATVTGGVAIVGIYETFLPYAAEQNAVAAIQRTLTDNRDAKGTLLESGALGACDGKNITFVYKSIGAETIAVSEIIINNTFWNLDQKTKDCRKTIESIFYIDGDRNWYKQKIDGAHNSYLLSRGEIGDEWHEAKFFVINGKFDQTSPQPPSSWKATLIRLTNELT